MAMPSMSIGKVHILEIGNSVPHTIRNKNIMCSFLVFHLFEFYLALAPHCRRRSRRSRCHGIDVPAAYMYIVYTANRHWFMLSSPFVAMRSHFIYFYWVFPFHKWLQIHYYNNNVMAGAYFSCCHYERAKARAHSLTRCEPARSLFRCGCQNSLSDRVKIR